MAIEGAPPVAPVEPVAQPPVAPVAASGPSGTPDPAIKAWETEKAGYLRDLQAERKKRQEFEGRFTATQAELDQERRRVQALAGVNPQSATEQEDEAIRARLEQLGIPRFSKEDMEAFRAMQAQASQMAETNSMVWADKARTTVQAVESSVAKELGGTALSASQSKAVRAAFIQAAEESPEFLKRYEQGDKTLVEEFAKRWVEDWIEPARRHATQQSVERFRPVPGAKDRSIPGAPGTKIDVTDPKAVENLLVQGFKERGGQFGRR